MASQHTGPVVLLTGCSEGGIGYSLAKAFHERGCRVFASARRLESMASLEGIGIDILKIDVTSDASVATALAQLVSRTSGRIDILVNNAGVSATAPLVDMPLDRTSFMFEANVVGTLRMARAVAPYMTKRKSGLVMNIGSVVADVPFAYGGVYAATKSALSTISAVLRTELKPFGVNVMLVKPGGVTSNIAVNQEGVWDPTGSVYAPVAQDIFKRQRISQDPAYKSMPSDEFATAVVDQALRRNPPRRFLYGGSIWLMWFLSLLPEWLVQAISYRKFGLSKLAALGT